MKSSKVSARKYFSTTSKMSAIGLDFNEHLAMVLKMLWHTYEDQTSLLGIVSQEYTFAVAFSTS